jgi:hypothetical protein
MISLARGRLSTALSPTTAAIAGPRQLGAHANDTFHSRLAIIPGQGHAVRRLRLESPKFS